MKLSITKLSSLALGFLLLIGCSKETVDPNLTGSIEGQVQKADTGEPIAGVSITTNPGTDAILTNTTGQFSIQEVPTGNYSIQAQKENFVSRTVRVNVKEDRTAIAQILLPSDEQSSSNDINAEVTSSVNVSRNDSSFVEVNYRVMHTGNSSLIPNYEVYFQIYTAGPSFFVEIAGDSLNSGEQNIGSFSKYIRNQIADSVTISHIYAPSS